MESRAELLKPAAPTTPWWGKRLGENATPAPPTPPPLPRLIQRATLVSHACPPLPTRALEHPPVHGDISLPLCTQGPTRCGVAQVPALSNPLGGRRGMTCLACASARLRSEAGHFMLAGLAPHGGECLRVRGKGLNGCQAVHAPHCGARGVLPPAALWPRPSTPKPAIQARSAPPPLPVCSCHLSPQGRPATAAGEAPVVSGLCG